MRPGALATRIRENISQDAEAILSDEFGALPRAGALPEHESIKHRARIYVDGGVDTSTVESAFGPQERCIVGAWHPISASIFPPASI